MSKESLRPRRQKDTGSETTLENTSENAVVNRSTDQEISTTQPVMTELMTSLLQSCPAQYEALAKERIEHQKQLKWE